MIVTRRGTSLRADGSLMDVDREKGEKGAKCGKLRACQ
jgi:hypothetical protein